MSAVMLAVVTATGLPMIVGKAVLDPNVPTLFEGELPPEVEFQKVNLRIREVEGPDDPTLANAPYRTADGETIDPRNPEANPEDVLERGDPEALKAEIVRLRTDLVSAVDPDDHEDLKSELTKVKGELQAARTEVTTLRATLEGAISPDAHDAVVKERDDLKTEVERLNGLLAQTSPPESAPAEVNGQTETQKPSSSPAYSVEGLSPEQNADLLAAFATREALDAATDEQIDAIRGFGPKAIETIRAWQKGA